MQQTLLAILGMMTITLLSFNQSRALLQSRQAMLDDEMEVMASGIALQAMEYIGTKSFDESTKDSGVSASEPGAFTTLTALSENLVSTIPRERRCTLLPSREGANGYDECDDLSDYNEMTKERLPMIVGVDTVLFEVSARVRYLDNSRQPMASGSSKNKEVIVLVEQARLPGKPVLLRNPVQVSRTFSLP